MHSNLVAKIHSVTDNMDGLVASLLGVALRQEFTSPGFDEMQVTAEGMVYLHADSPDVSPVFVGPLDAIQHALVRVAGQARLSNAEMAEFEQLFRLSTGSCLYH